MSNVSIDLNGSAPGTNNTTTYNDSTDPNPTVNLFSAASITENGGGTIASITIAANPNTWTSTETLALDTPLPSGFTVTTNSDGTLTITSNSGSGSVSDWQSILDSVTYTNSADVPNQTGYRTFTVSAVGGPHTTVQNSATDTLNVTCFCAGTMVRTPDREVSVETLKRGDLVLTADGRSMPIDWLGRQTVSTLFGDPLRVLPIRIKAGALAENVPSRDLLVSPDHALLVEGALIQAGALVNGSSIVRERNVPRVFTYYHVELDDHSLIVAENTPAETFVDNVDRLGFDNWAEHEALYPNGKHVEELPYPRAKSHRQVPVSIRVMLGARAQKIGAFESSAVA
jgi:hypothetical protein